MCVDLLIFPFGGNYQHAWHFSYVVFSTGTKLFRTLWNSPHEVIIFTSVISNLTFQHDLYFITSVAAFLFAITPPYIGEYHTSTTTRGTLSGGTLAALSSSLPAVAAAEEVESSKIQN
jgi:hypothetical protein